MSTRSHSAVGSARSAQAILSGDQLKCTPDDDLKSEALTRIRSLAAARASIEANILSSTRDMAADIGQELLRDKGFVDVDELTSGGRRRWRAETKRLACAELEVCLGVGIKEARHMVGLACAPLPVRDHVEGALRHGVITWGHARGFWSRCGSLQAETAAMIAESLFGTNAATAVAERRHPDGTLREQPWFSAEYWAALEREAVRAEGQDVLADRERRAHAREQRHTHLRVDDDSTATFFLTGPVTTLAAVYARVDRCARSLRKAGDARTLAQLRSDVAQTLLLHGQIIPPKTESDPLITPRCADDIAQIASAQAPVHLQVVVPWDILTGQACCTKCSSGRAHAAPNLRSPSGPHRASQQNKGPSDVAEVLGAYPAFITPAHVRELALAPGTTLSRILIDPADGRLVERSIKTYRPDAAMRRQIIAADVSSRAPGRRGSAANCELDHVTAWSDGGKTTEPNLCLTGVSHHQLKTEGWWSSKLGSSRDVTWETLLGQRATTRVHDYRQYLRQGATVGETAQVAFESNLDDDPNAEFALDRACLALYAALAHRDPHDLLTGTDDIHGATDHNSDLDGWISINHRDANGRTRLGAPAGHPTLPQVLGMPDTDKRPTSIATPWSGPGTDEPPF